MSGSCLGGMLRLSYELETLQHVFGTFVKSLSNMLIQIVCSLIEAARDARLTLNHAKFKLHPHAWN